MNRTDPHVQKLADELARAYFPDMASPTIYLQDDFEQFSHPFCGGSANIFSHFISINTWGQAYSDDWREDTKRRKRLERLLKHEMIHLWLHQKGLDRKHPFIDEWHNEQFLKKAYEIGLYELWTGENEEQKRVIHEAQMKYKPGYREEFYKREASERRNQLRKARESKFWRHLGQTEVGPGAFIFLVIAAVLCLATFATSGMYWVALALLVWSLAHLLFLTVLGIKRANIPESYFFVSSVLAVILGISSFFGRMAATNETQLYALFAAIGVALVVFFIWLHLPSRSRK